MHQRSLVLIKQVLRQEVSKVSVGTPKYIIQRKSVVGDEGEWVKMFDPPKESPVLPERMKPTNPVPEVMAAVGYQKKPTVLHTVKRELLKSFDIDTWDKKKKLKIFSIADGENPAASGGTWPGATIRVPRGTVFHCKTSGQSPPPHTIHWHGLEPTPINDGVGHCSMEIGDHTYQLQPNFIGTYFDHCHRNTVQHFEFGLYELFIVEPPDAFFSSIAATNPDGTVRIKTTIPIGACRDGKRRTAANVGKVLLPDGTIADYSAKFPGFNSNPIQSPDPLGKYPVDPHANTVPYDVEALWVFDDRDSVWSDLGKNAKATYPMHGTNPGVNDHFHNNGIDPAAPDDFFAFNDFNADYWFITGVPIPAHKGETGTIPSDIVVPPQLNSGVSGSQVSITANMGKKILIRCLDAAYNCTTVRFPLDAVIIAWDGRALGVPPFGKYNNAYLVPANDPIHFSVARRFDALIDAPTSPMDLFATVDFIDTRGQVPGEPENKLSTGRIPIHIGDFGWISGKVAINKISGVPLAGVEMTLTGPVTRKVWTDINGDYIFPRLQDDMYKITPSLAGYKFLPSNKNVPYLNKNVEGVNFVAMQL